MKAKFPQVTSNYISIPRGIRFVSHSHKNDSYLTGRRWRTGISERFNFERTAAPDVSGAIETWYLSTIIRFGKRSRDANFWRSEMWRNFFRTSTPPPPQKKKLFSDLEPPPPSLCFIAQIF